MARPVDAFSWVHGSPLLVIRKALANGIRMAVHSTYINLLALLQQKKPEHGPKISSQLPASWHTLRYIGITAVCPVPIVGRATGCHLKADSLTLQSILGLAYDVRSTSYVPEILFFFLLGACPVCLPAYSRPPASAPIPSVFCVFFFPPNGLLHPD